MKSWILRKSECYFYIISMKKGPLIVRLTIFEILGQKFIKFLSWFFGRLKTPKSHFEINWPLPKMSIMKLKKPVWKTMRQIQKAGNPLGMGLINVIPVILKQNTVETSRNTSEHKNIKKILNRKLMKRFQILNLTNQKWT